MARFNPYEAPRSRQGGQGPGPPAHASVRETLTSAVKTLASPGFYWGILWRIAVVLVVVFFLLGFLIHHGQP